MAARYRRYWYIHNDMLALVEEKSGGKTINYTVEDFDSISTDGIEIRVHATVLDKNSNYDAINDIPGIPVQFHEALVFKAIATLYEDPRQQKLDMAQYFEQKYQLKLREAKKFARRNRQTGGVVKPYDM